MNTREESVNAFVTSHRGRPVKKGKENVNNSSENQNQKNRPKRCHFCNKLGHLSRYCYKKKDSKKSDNERESVLREARLLVVTTDVISQCLSTAIMKV